MVVRVEHLPVRGDEGHLAGAVVLQDLQAGAVGDGPHGEEARVALALAGLDDAGPAGPDLPLHLGVVLPALGLRFVVRQRRAEQDAQVPDADLHVRVPLQQEFAHPCHELLPQRAVRIEVDVLRQPGDPLVGRGALHLQLGHAGEVAVVDHRIVCLGRSGHQVGPYAVAEGVVRLVSQQFAQAPVADHLMQERLVHLHLGEVVRYVQSDLVRLRVEPAGDRTAFHQRFLRILVGDLVQVPGDHHLHSGALRPLACASLGERHPLLGLDLLR